MEFPSDRGFSFRSFSIFRRSFRSNSPSIEKALHPESARNPNFAVRRCGSAEAANPSPRSMPDIRASAGGGTFAANQWITNETPQPNANKRQRTCAEMPIMAELSGAVRALLTAWLKVLTLFKAQVEI